MFTTKVPILAIIGLVSACGGSGGGGPFDPGWVPAPGTVTDFQGPLTDVSSSVTVAPRYSHIGFDGPQSTTTSRGPSDPGGLALEIDPGAGTVTRNLGSQSPVLQIDFDDDTQVFDSDSVLFYGFTHRGTILIPGTASGFQHVSYGVWSEDITSCVLSSCGSEFYGDAFYFGWPTGSSGMPGSGQATYTGTMRGYHSPYSQSAVSISGDATLVADFTNRDLTGSFHNITTSTILGSGVSGFADIQIAANISGGELNGTVTGAGGSGTIDGRFFGPSAQELGGTFRMTGNGHTIGAFAAKQ